MPLRVPGRIEAGCFRGSRLLDGVIDDLLRRLVIAALLRQNEHAEFHWIPRYVVVLSHVGQLDPTLVA